MLTLFLSCGGNKLPVAEESYTSNFAPKKAYVVIRSEGGPQNVQRVRDILAADFSENNVSTQYSLYRAKQAWNQNEIFNTAYKGQYDFIVLIDQVAKFTIDNKTQVGGKYQIRSYHVKSPNPEWLDLGQSTCNISVVPSVQKFSREVIRSIVGNQAAFKGHDFDYDDSVASRESTNSVNTTDSSKDLTSEIEMLRKELEEEKERTRLAEKERVRLENQLKLEIAAQEQRAKIAQIEAEDAALKKRQRQRQIAEEYAAKREEIRKREIEEDRNKPIVVDTEPKEPTREERKTAREEAKKRIAEQKEAARREMAEAAEAKKEERRRLEELEREERRRLKEEIEAQRKNKERLAEEDLQRIKAKVAEERRQAEELDRQKKEAERLAKEKEKEEKRKAELRQAQQAEQSKIEKKRAEELAQQERNVKRIAREEEAKRQEELLKAQRLQEKRQAEQRLAELEAQEQQRLATLKTKNQSTNTSVNNNSSATLVNPNAFIVIRGKEEDKKQFEDLEDYIEFDFMFAKAKSKTTFFNPSQSISLANIMPRTSQEQNIIILIDQKEYLGDGKYLFEIKRMKKLTENNWNKISSEAYNLNVKGDLKLLSKKITEYLSN